jgi:DNA-binding beta-propeller fold protein YncE
MRKSVLVVLCALANSPAAAKDTGLIFVSNEKTNNIVVMDPASYKIVKEIKTARHPRDLHFNADHSKLYVACGDDDVIDIVDVAKLDVVGRLKTGPSPEAFGIDEKRGRLYVSQEEGSSLAVIDMERDKVAADSGKIVRDVVAGLRPRRIAATPDGRDLWVTAELAGEVDIVDRATFAITGKIPFLPPGMRKSEVTPVGLAMTKDGRTAFVALGHAAHVAVVDVLGRKVLGYILVGKRPWGLTLSRDENTLYVANGFGDDITVIDTKTARRKSRCQSAAFPMGSRSMTRPEKLALGL